MDTLYAWLEPVFVKTPLYLSVVPGACTPLGETVKTVEIRGAGKLLPTMILGPNSDVPFAAKYSDAVRTMPTLTPLGVGNEK